MGLNSSLSSPTSEQVCKKRGGGGWGGVGGWGKVDSDGLCPDSRMMIFDHSLKGQRLQGLPRLRKEFCISSSMGSLRVFSP